MSLASKLLRMLAAGSVFLALYGSFRDSIAPEPWLDAVIFSLFWSVFVTYLVIFIVGKIGCWFFKFGREYCPECKSKLAKYDWGYSCPKCIRSYNLDFKNSHDERERNEPKNKDV